MLENAAQARRARNNAVKQRVIRLLYMYMYIKYYKGVLH